MTNEEQHDAEPKMPELVWNELAPYALRGSDRVSEQYGTTYGGILAWVELHRLDDLGVAYKNPHWVIWFQMADDLEDTWNVDEVFSTEGEAKEAVADLLAQVKP